MKRFSTRVLAIAAGIAFACGIAAAQDAAVAEKPAEAKAPAEGAGPRGEGMRGMRQGGGMGAMMKIRLLKDMPLSEATSATIAKVEKENQEALKGMREEMTKMRSETDPEKRKAAGEALRAKRDELNKKAEAAIDAALTADQKAELEKKLKELPQRPRGEGPGRGEGYGRPGAGAAGTTAPAAAKTE